MGKERAAGLEVVAVYIGQHGKHGAGLTGANRFDVLHAFAKRV
jgi:hypothetical protein